MMDRCTMVKFIEALPWPERTRPRLVVRAAPDNSAYMVILHEPISRGWTDGAKLVGPTPEGAFRLALEAWLTEKRLKPGPVFRAALASLRN